jgi:hypothetical protein
MLLPQHGQQRGALQAPRTPAELKLARDGRSLGGTGQSTRGRLATLGGQPYETCLPRCSGSRESPNAGLAAGCEDYSEREVDEVEL